MSDNVKIIQDAYTAFGQGDIPGLLSALDENVQWDHPEAAAVAWGGSFRGHDGVVRFFTAIGESADFLAFEPRTFVADGDNVVVLGYEKVKAKSTGREYETHWVHAFTLKDGKVVTFREYTDTAAASAAFS